jgi:hypothetical protein
LIRRSVNSFLWRIKNFLLKDFQPKGKAMSYKILIIKALCGCLFKHNAIHMTVVRREYKSERPV